jgi:hypothetical protein
MSRALGIAAVLVVTGVTVACGNDFTSGDGPNGNGTTSPTQGDDPDNLTPTGEDTDNDLEIDPTQETSGGVAYDNGIPVEHRVDQHDKEGDYAPEPPGASTEINPGGGTPQVYEGNGTTEFNPPLGNAVTALDIAIEDSPPPDDAPKVDANGKPIWNREVYTVTRNGVKVTCYGSLYNCEMPNSQPGKRRFLPTTVVDEVTSKLDGATDATQRGDIIHTVLSEKGEWAITGSPMMFDGTGIARGTVKDPTVRINFGQRKRIGGVLNVYAWSANIAASNGVSYLASGWIPQTSITSTQVSSMMPTATAPAPAAGKYAYTKSSKTKDFVYYSLKTAADYGCADGYLPTKCLPSWAATLDISPDSRNAQNKVMNFFLREGEVTNDYYQTPWAGATATDTVGASGSVIFRRIVPTAHHRTLLRIPLFEPGKHKVVGGITFLYGQLNGRWGWVNAYALKVVPAPTDPCDGKDPGVAYCSTDHPQNVLVCAAGGGGGSNDAVCPLSEHCSEADPVTHEAVVDANGNVVCVPN